MFAFGEWFAAQMYMEEFSVQYFVKCIGQLVKKVKSDLKEIGTSET
jgi:hypothetical protein